jgi:tetratricopeptide (TPR) repeat protein
VIGYSLLWGALTLGLYLLIIVVRRRVVIAVRWVVQQVKQPWKRLLRAIDYNDCVAAYKAGGQAAVDEAWRLHARARPYADRPQRRFRVATASVDGMVGSTLLKESQWEDALAHLLPAITGLRETALLQPNLNLHLQDAAVAMLALQDPESALPLIDESLALLRQKGQPRWQMAIYYRGLRLRTGCLRELGRLDEAVQMAAEVVMAAGKRSTPNA